MEYNGVIEEIEDGVAWGTFDDGRTFDVPVNGHALGDAVKLMVHDGTEDEDCDYEHSLIIFGKTKATLYATVETEEGLEIVFMREFEKNSN